MDIQDIQMQLSTTIESCIESIDEMGNTRFYDEYDFPKDDRRVEELVDFISGQSSDNDIDFEVGYLKGLETALRIVMR
jgi:hypothetical protein|tara:strand:+ start:184 stop:417 length:234 start_codon:yes stop_codon:yes gene_type:complete